MRTFLAIVLGLIFLISLSNVFMSSNIIASSVSLLTITIIVCTMALKYSIEDNSELIDATIKKIKNDA